MLDLRKFALRSSSGFVLALGMLIFAPGATHAQGSGQQQSNPNNGQTNWADSLRQARAENEALTKILSSIQSIDTARQNELIQWIITDRNVRSRVISALRKNGYAISPNSVAEMTVTQKPPTSGGNDMQLLRLVIEQVRLYGEPNIRRILGPDLYDKIRSRDSYVYTLISTELVQQKIQFVYIDASLFGGSILFKSGFGFAVRVGNDYVGYPFWLPGTIGTFGILRRGTTDFRIGLEWPLGESGVSPFNLSGSIRIKERKLTGSTAFSAYIDQELGLLAEQSGKLHFGGDFTTAFTPQLSNFPAFANLPQYRSDFRGFNKDSLYYLAMSAHAWVTYRLPQNVLPGAYITAGAGTHSIQPVTIGTPKAGPGNGDLYFPDRLSFFDPLIKLGYVHTGDSGDEYGLSVQYCNTLLTDAWVKLFPWLQLEAKYATIIGRDPQKWEWKDYVMVSPKLTLNF